MLTRRRTRKRLLGWDVTDGPAAEPIATAEAKTYLNVTQATDDALIDSMIKAARRHIEKKTHRALITQTVRTMWAASDLPLRVLRPPVQRLASVVTVYQGVETDETEADFYIFGANGVRPELCFTTSGSWAARSIEEVWISTLNGYGDAAAAVPDDLIQAMYRALSVMYDHRDLFLEGTSTVEDLPLGIDDLIEGYIVPVV